MTIKINNFSDKIAAKRMKHLFDLLKANSDFNYNLSKEIFKITAKMKKK